MLRRGLLGAACAGLLPACGLVARQPGREAAAVASPAASPRASGTAPLPQQWARIAWRYVENNTDYDSGLVGGLDRSPVFTAWNAADALAAVTCAFELLVIDEREFDLRVSRLLGFLATMDLSGGQLPNKAYHAVTGKMIGFDGRPADIGWTAVDVGRLLLWLRIVGLRHPRLREYADQAVLRWRFCEVIDDCGELRGLSRVGGQAQRYQEGRLGYEQLAGAGFAAWGFRATRATGLPELQTANVLGVPVRYDARDPRTSGAPAPVLTMPYVLAGLEYGWQAPDGSTALRELAQSVYRVQETRWRREGHFTARTDYQLREAPWVVLDSVYASGYAWNTLGGDGREHEKLALVATRAAFGMHALWPGEYATRLLESVRFLHDPDRGWFEGRFEQGGAPNAAISLTTNAAVLEALLFRAKGRLYPEGPAAPGPFELRARDPYARLDRCWPAERGACAAVPTRPQAGG